MKAFLGILWVLYLIGCATPRRIAPTAVPLAPASGDTCAAIPADPLKPLGIYFGADLAVDLYGERPKIDAYGNLVELYAFIAPERGWEGRDEFARTLSEWKGERKLAVLNVPVEVEGEPGWRYAPFDRDAAVAAEEVARVERRIRDAGFERVVVQEILPVRPFRGGTILELGNNPEHFDWFKIVRVVSDWTRNAWTLPDIEGLRLDGPP